MTVTPTATVRCRAFRCQQRALRVFPPFVASVNNSWTSAIRRQSAHLCRATFLQPTCLLSSRAGTTYDAVVQKFTPYGLAW